MDSTTAKPFDEWAIVEIMGHQRYAGRVSEQTIAGGSLLRIDIPATPRQPAYTKLFGVGSVYAITPVTEELAKATAASINASPISIYDLPEAMQEKLRAPSVASLPGPRDDDSDDSENSYDEYEYREPF
jgi:hypothetical protein